MNREDNSMIPSDAEFDRQTAGKLMKARSADFDGWLFKYVAVYDDDEIEVNEVYHCSPSAAVFARADLIVKVKEPQPTECAMLRPDQILFTYLPML